MKLLSWSSISARRRKLMLWFLGLLLLYTVLGFLILPPIVRIIAVKQLSKQLDREVSIGSVKINPFVLSTTVRGLLIKDKDGQPFVSWDEVYVNFQISSLFTKAWTFKEVSTSKPYVRVQMNKDYTFNFSDLIAKFSTKAAPAPAPAGPKTESKPLVLHIGRLHIAGAVAGYADFTTREPFKRTLGPLDITLDDFRTDPDNRNPYSFSGTTDAGERIAWSGFFYLDPLRSRGDLTLDNFTLNKYAPLYQDLVRFEIRSGNIGVHVSYHFELNATNRVVQVNNTAFALRNLKLGVPGDSNNIVDLPQFAVAGVDADLKSRQATVDYVTLSGANVFLKRDKNEAINVVEAAKPSASATNAPGGILFLLRSVTNAVTMLLESTNQWSGTVRTVEITNCALHLQDLVNSRPATLDLTGIHLAAKNISNVPGTNLTADFSMRWNTNGSIALMAIASFLPPTADVKLDLDQLDLGSLDPYLEPKLNLYILGSKIDLHGVIEMKTPPAGLPQVTFDGNAGLDDFHTVDGDVTEDLLKWDSLRYKGIVASLNPESVAVKEVDLDNAFVRLIIETNKSINVFNALRMTNAPATNEVKTAASKEASSTTNSALPQISVGAFVISNAVVSFTDRSVSPNVNMTLEGMEGYISDISSDQTRNAEVHLGASVDGAGPVAITGSLNPLSPTATNELTISLKDMDLTPLSAYAGKFAGYGISQGKLNLDMDYELIGKNIKSRKNVITLDHFTFGDKVESPEATHLPVRLGVEILTDREGKIVLDVPVEGRTDKPELRISNVVLSAIKNILAKVATSPFALLGAVFGGGGEELGYQDFTPGGAELSADDVKKLDSLMKALYERPALALEISGSVDPAGDREGWQRVMLDRQIRSRIWMKQHKSEQMTNEAAQIVLSPDDRAAWVKKLYSEAVSANKITPELLAANTNLAGFAAQVLPRASRTKRGASDLMKPLVTENAKATAAYQTKLVPPPDATEAVLLATIPVSESDLETLAAARAKVIQDYLLQSGKVGAGRIFLTAKPGGLRLDGSRAYLQFR